MPHPVAEYFTDLQSSLSIGVPETSGYPALSKLLNAVGDSLKPKISVVFHPAKGDAGIPDAGFFSAKELRKHGTDAPSLLTLKPERGVLEVKPLALALADFESSPQVLTYLAHYGQILLTNFRSFALWSMRDGKPFRGETHTIAESAEAFWSHAREWREKPDHPQHDRLFQYLRRALLSTARITAPEDLAAFLASYAREARARMEAAPSNTLAPISEALGGALGIRFEGEKGAHFFRSTLIQTLFYGVFSAWVLWNEKAPRPGDRFRWREAAYHLGLPVLRTLFHQLTDPKPLRALHLDEVLDWAEDALARVDRAAFFARFALGEAVQYFYEPFLAEFDPELRRQFGVWYTPPEIVKYMVARVDAALVENYGIRDGLADPRVVVLDPCCGTGAYLVETLRVIYERLKDNVGPNQAALLVRGVAQKRLFGFELLPAPYVIAHLQIDLLLQRWNGALDHDKDERAGVFLTNALTGWVPPEEPKTLLFPELIAERDAADRVKREAEILVIIGNPPYDGYAGLSVEEERGLSEAYRETKEAPKPQGQGLNDLYVRFFRMAERRIVEGAPKDESPDLRPPLPEKHGIVCYISNYSWLDGLSHPGMRERFLEVFDRITVDCLNGDKYKTGKRAPDGTPDPSIFSAEHNREGIQVGTAIALLERWPRAVEKKAPGEVHFLNWWGKAKREGLLAALNRKTKYERLKPALPLGLPFVPVKVRKEFKKWALLTELLPQSYPGVKTSRDAALVDIDRETLELRLSYYLDAKVSHAEMRVRCPQIMENSKMFKAEAVRDRLRTRGRKAFSIVRYAYKPLDHRWLAWESGAGLLDRARPEFFDQVFEGNHFVEARQHQIKDDFDRGYPCTVLGDNFGNGLSNFFPLFLRTETTTEAPFSSVVRETSQMDFDMGGGSEPSGPQPNLTPFARNYLHRLSCQPEDLFFHIVAVLHAPLYREENAGALRQDWPRVPLPEDAETLRAGAELGRKVAALLDPETDVPGVTDNPTRPDLRGLGELTVAAKSAADLAIAARWGYAGQGGVTMPGAGKVTNGTRGEGFVDIHLNETTRWKDVPEAVWAYTLGGYQVLKKWLSYRESTLLGRALTAEEAQQFTLHVRRIAALVALRPRLDAHYEAVAAA